MTTGSGSSAADSPRVPAIDRAFALLQALGRTGSASLAELVEATSVNKSTAFYALRTLEALDVVRYDRDSRVYRLGPTLVDLGSAASRQLDTLAAARRELPGLVEELDATIVLYRRVARNEVIILDRFERLGGVRITVEPGTHLPIQGGSFGRAFLAYDSHEIVEELLEPGLVRFTRKSVTDLADFRRDLATIRRQGWGIDHEGFALGVSAVAAPIFDPDGEVRLVAAAVGFAAEIDDGASQKYGESLRRTSDRIGRPWRPGED